MMIRRLLVTAAIAPLALSVVATPAAAQKGKPVDKGSAVTGTTTVMFTKSVKRKFAKDGIVVTSVAPAKKRNAVKFTFPAKQVTPQEITHTGGLQFGRADASLTLTDFVFDIENGTVDVTVPGVGTVPDALDLAKVKLTKKTVSARLNVALGQAQTLNAALQTQLFADGMFLATAKSKFESALLPAP